MQVIVFTCCRLLFFVLVSLFASVSAYHFYRGLLAHIACRASFFFTIPHLCMFLSSPPLLTRQRGPNDGPEKIGQM